jgi:putative transposase
MSNHVHYLIKPARPDDMPKIMHWLNWYTAMCFNRMLNRTGHFWEKRYHCTGFPESDKRRALNTLRYIHGNPKAAKMQQGFFYDFSNYGIYDRLTDDGITQWHPAFLALGDSLDDCAEAYRQFCKKYKPQPKPEKRNYWGSKKLANLKPKKKLGKDSPGQRSFWEDWNSPDDAIREVAEKFVLANCFDSKIAMQQFKGSQSRANEENDSVPGNGSSE